jgi:hypothetical protein
MNGFDSDEIAGQLQGPRRTDQSKGRVGLGNLQRLERRQVQDEVSDSTSSDNKYSGHPVHSTVENRGNAAEIHDWRGFRLQSLLDSRRATI